MGWIWAIFLPFPYPSVYRDLYVRGASTSTIDIISHKNFKNLKINNNAIKSDFIKSNNVHSALLKIDV